MKHLDLFSGIGGFALAVDTVWPNSEHIFCDNDLFCQQVLKKHWPKSKIYGDIKRLTKEVITNARGSEQRRISSSKREEISKIRYNTDVFTGESTANSESFGERRCSSEKCSIKKRIVVKDKQERSEVRSESERCDSIDLITGGFPCQPFSQAGRRQGTSDDRYLWPEMFRIIREVRPRWIIAENVAGLITWNNGMVLEQVCSDLEIEGHEVQPFIIPAVSVNAPHRRDRVWIVAYSSSSEYRGRRGQDRKADGIQEVNRQEIHSRGISGTSEDVADTKSKRLQEYELCKGSTIIKDGGDVTNTECKGYEGKVNQKRSSTRYNRGTQHWDQNWLEVATKLCGVDDGLPTELDGFKLSKAGHRNARLKALGNAIVPQVAVEIMKIIKLSESEYIYNRY